MGQTWDGGDIAFRTEVWREAMRVLKPGGHLLAFSGTRTYHRMTVAIEDAGFEIRDQIMWVYGSGFPKSLDVSKAIDKIDGIGQMEDRARAFTAWMRSTGITAKQINDATESFMGSHYLTDKSQPAVATADLFDLLRPLLPPVPEEIEELVRSRTVEIENMKRREVVAMQRLPDTSVVRAGFVGMTAPDGVTPTREVAITAAHTADARRWSGWGTALKPAHEPICVARKPLEGTVAGNVLKHGTGAINVDGCRVGTEGGRWPANFIHDGSEEATAGLGEAARFFYTAKARRDDREEGCDDLPKRTGAEAVERDEGSAGTQSPRAGAGRSAAMIGNHHPTVKPTELMRHLCRLVTPPGGTVLDPFMGSGSTGRGAMLEGFRFIGCELSPEYAEIALGRIRYTLGPLFAREADYG